MITCRSNLPPWMSYQNRNSGSHSPSSRPSWPNSRLPVTRSGLPSPLTSARVMVWNWP